MAAKASDVRAGGAYVEVTARDQFTKTLAALKARAQAFAGGLRSVGLALTLPGAAAVLPALFRGLDRASEVKLLAEQLGESVEMAQKLKFAMDATGLSVEDVLRRVADPKIAALLSRAPVLSTAEIDRQIDATREWRATLAELEAALQHIAQAFLPVLQAAAAFVNANKGAVVTLTLLGVTVWASGMAIRVLSVTVAALTTAFTFAKAAAVALKGALATLPGVLAAVGIGMVALDQSGGRFAQLGLVFVAVAAAIKVLPILFAAASAAVALVAGAFAVAKVAAVAFWAAATAPVALLVAALAAASVAVVAFFGTQRDELRASAGAWAGFQDQVGDTFSGIFAAVGKGDLEGAFKVLTTSLQLVWARFVAWITDKWNDFKDVVVDTFKDIRDGFEQSFDLTLDVLQNAGQAYTDANDPDSELAKRFRAQQEAMDARRAADRAARRADQDAAVAELEQAKREFEQAVKDARAVAPKPKREEAPKPKEAEVPKAQEFQGLVSGVRGAFRRLGEGSMQFQDQRGLEVQRRQLEIQREQLNELHRIGDGIQGIQVPRFGP